MALHRGTGVPLFSMARGAGDEERASRIMGNSFALLLASSVILTAVGFGVTGVFLAESISNVIGGFACYLTMRMTAYRRLGRAGCADA